MKDGPDLAAVRALVKEARKAAADCRPHMTARDLLNPFMGEAARDRVYQTLADDVPGLVALAVRLADALETEALSRGQVDPERTELCGVSGDLTAIRETHQFCVGCDAAALIAVLSAQAERLARADAMQVVVDAAKEYVVAERAWLDSRMGRKEAHASDAAAARLRDALSTPDPAAREGGRVRPDSDGTIEIEFYTADLPKSRPTIPPEDV